MTGISCRTGVTAASLEAFPLDKCIFVLRHYSQLSEHTCTLHLCIADTELSRGTVCSST